MTALPGRACTAVRIAGNSTAWIIDTHNNPGDIENGLILSSSMSCVTNRKFCLDSQGRTIGAGFVALFQSPVYKALKNTIGDQMLGVKEFALPVKMMWTDQARGSQQNDG